MTYKIGMKNPHNAASLYYNLMTKEEDIMYQYLSAEYCPF